MAEICIKEVLTNELDAVKEQYQEVLKEYKQKRIARNAAWSKVMEIEDGKSYDGYQDDLNKAYKEYESAGKIVEQADEELERLEDMIYHIKALLMYY